MYRILFLFCLALAMGGCSMLLGLDEYSGYDSSSVGGSAGQGGSGGNTGGQGGTGGTGGQGGTAGAGGQGGSGGNPCTGIYVELDSVTGQSSYPHTAGNVTYATYNVYGTSIGNELNDLVQLVNNVGGNFTVPVSTTALEAVRLRCADPFGGPGWTVACSKPLTSGAADCPAPGCYSASSGVIQMQVQINPALNQSDTVRIGINPDKANNPTFVTVCGSQALLPVMPITGP